MEEIETGSESTESGVSESPSPEGSGSQSDTGSASAAPKQEQEIDWSKAFEHPRFKEVIGQKNDALSKYQDIESKYKALEQQLNSFKESQPKAPTETDALLADLKNVDPRLANALARALKAAELSETNKQQLENYQRESQESARQNTLSTAVAKINSLHEVNKMSDFGKQFINNQLDLSYRSGNLKAHDLKAVEAAYGEASKAIKAYEDSFKRDVTKSYVQDKTKDASVPTSVPKGTQARPAQKPLNVPRDKEGLKAAVVKSFLKEQAAEKSATNN